MVMFCENNIIILILISDLDYYTQVWIESY